MKRTRIAISTSLLALLILATLAGFLLVGCATSITPVATPIPTIPPPTALPPPSPTPVPTATPTPLPAILNQALRRYDAPNGAFSLQVPTDWPDQEIAGGVLFTAPEHNIRLTALFQPIPVTTDPVAALSGIITNTLTEAQNLNPAAFAFLRDEKNAEGHRVIEFVGQIEPDQPLAHVVAELWNESSAVVGLSLAADDTQWQDVAPIGPVIFATYTLNDISQVRQNLGLVYVHPTDLFTVTIPYGWGIVSEEDDTVLFGDVNGYAQYMVTTTVYDHRPTLPELVTALNDALGDLPQQAEYVELANEDISRFEHMIRFESLSEDGFYRTELRAFSAGNLLYTTSFSAPPHDWDLYMPDYELMRSSLHPQTPPPPSEEEQDANSIAGIFADDVTFYRAGGGALWVSAPIHNNRTRNLSHITAAVKLYDANKQLIGAESWQMQQRILAAGHTTYLTQRITPDVLALDGVDFVQIEIVNAKDTTQEAPPAWGYDGGEAKVDNKQNVILNIHMRNASNDTRKRIYVIALLYGSQGEPVFARAETRTLPYAVPPGESVDLKITVWGPLPDVASFDVVGEVPR
ncbi:MAG: hypothetical protein GXP37_10510 [Chloroflexi bacterium]|nr:hypothetical protein [Chloroflexota bacterium]